MLKVIGFLLAVISFPVLFMNEGRAVKTAKSLEEGAAVVAHVENSPVKDSKEGKLVHFTGLAVTKAPLRDPIFNVEAKALQLSRKVEMYQWKQQTDSSHRTAHETGSIYRKEWSGELQTPKDFQVREGHENPDAMPFPSSSQNASDVTVGEFQIPERVISDLNGDFTPWTLDEKTVEAVPATTSPGHRKPKLDQGNLYYGKDPSEPEVGDVRVRFAVKGLSELSVIGRQHGKTVEPYPTKVGEPVEMALVGSHDAREMFDGAIKSNTVLTWVVRGGGFLLMFFGALMVLRLHGWLRFLPFIGSAINAGAGLLAFGLASTASLVTIGIAWFVYRPWLGLSFLVLGVVVGTLLLKRTGPRTVQMAR